MIFQHKPTIDLWLGQFLHVDIPPPSINTGDLTLVALVRTLWGYVIKVIEPLTTMTSSSFLMGMLRTLYFFLRSFDRGQLISFLLRLE